MSSLGAANVLLKRTANWQYGFKKLRDGGHLHISVENLVLLGISEAVFGRNTRRGRWPSRVDLKRTGWTLSLCPWSVTVSQPTVRKFPRWLKRLKWAWQGLKWALWAWRAADFVREDWPGLFRSRVGQLLKVAAAE